MLYYGKSIIGSSHEKKGTVCQDASGAVLLACGWAVAVVADGVGSAAHSDIASKIAVDTVIEVCQTRVSENTAWEELKVILRDAYLEAERRIEQVAFEKEESMIDYDTTLTAAIYDGKRIVYAHSGDGGIIGLSMDGRYVKITEPQKDEDHICVIPLRAGESAWVIEDCEEELAAIALATDGIYDTFFPYLLKGQESEIYVPLARYFLDNNYMQLSQENIDAVAKEKIDFIQSDAYKTVSDDKTLLVVVNDAAFPSFQPDEYYAEPDWGKLQLEWNRKAYPHLYDDKKTDGQKNETDGED